MANLLKNLEVTCVSLVNRAAVRDPSNPTQPQRLLLWKSEAHDDTGGPDMGTTDTFADALSKADLPDSVREAIEKAQDRETKLAKAESDLAALTAKVAELEKAATKRPSSDTEDEDEVDVEKADLPEPVKAMLRKAQADRKADAERIEKAEKAAADAEALAKAERDERITREFIAKAETDYASLSQDPQKLGPVLKSVSEKLSKDEASLLETVLKAADEQVRAGLLLKEMGRGGQPDPKPDSAIAKAQAIAVELQKADPTMSDEAALAKAMENRDLQAAYLAEMQGA